MDIDEDKNDYYSSNSSIMQDFYEESVVNTSEESIDEDKSIIISVKSKRN
jgi:hypothetical protein